MKNKTRDYNQIIPEYLNEDQIKALLNAIPYYEYRDIACIYLMLGCGLRVAEACSIRIKDLDFVAQQLTVRGGKGGKDRTVPMTANTMTNLKIWLQERPEGLVITSKIGGNSIEPRQVRIRDSPAVP